MDYTLTAPSPASGLIRNASGNFTVTLGVGDPGGTVVITPAASNGTFTPSTVSLTNVSRSATFTYTPTAVGVYTISVTNNGALVDPTGVTYTATTMNYTLTAPTTPSGNVDTASGNFTVTLGVGDPGGTVVITPAASNSDGAFTPSTVSLTNGSRTATFTYKPTAVGARNISVTNNGALTDPAAVVYTCTAQPTHLQTVIKNKSGASLTFSFLPPHGHTIADGATFAFYGDIHALTRQRWQDRDVQDFYRALATGKLEIVSSPASLFKDTASAAVKAVTAASGTLGVANPTWGAYTDS